MSHYWLAIAVFFVSLTGSMGCKDRRIKKSDRKSEIESLAKLVDGLAVLGKRRNQTHRQKSGTGTFSPKHNDPPEEPIDVESEKYLGWRGEINVPKLLELLKHENPAVRRQAASNLSRIEPLPPVALTAAILLQTVSKLQKCD